MSRKNQAYLQEQRLKIAAVALPLLCISPIIFHFLAALLFSFSPIDGYLLLGGTTSREAYAAALCSIYPDRTYVISGAASGPCLAKIFQDYEAPAKNVLVEACATSTFDNYFYSIPLLKAKGLKHIGLITGHGHMTRALPMGYILVCGQGMALTPCAPPGEYEENGHNESMEKTIMDTVRAVLWLLPAQYSGAQCNNVQPLSSFDPNKANTPGCACANILESAQDYYKNYIRTHNGQSGI